MTSGLAGSMTIALAPPLDCVVTFCCGVDFRLPAASALARSRWTAVATSFCWPIIASPSFWVQSSWLLIICSVCGNAVSDFTLTSQLLSFTAATAASPLRFGLVCDQRAASTISRG